MAINYNDIGFRPASERNLRRTEIENRVPTDENCPPNSSGIDLDEGGSELFDEMNFPDLGFPEFLSPIDEIDTSPYSGTGFIREINIFDEFFFLRTVENLFETNPQGEDVITIPGFHSQQDVMFKVPRIRSAYDTIVDGEIQTTNVEVDSFRVNNNKFWCLKGTEQTPVQEVWAQDNTDESLTQKYYTTSVASSDSQGVGNSLGYPLGSSTMQIFFAEQEGATIESMTTFYKDKVRPGIIHSDFNTSIQQPLLSSELSVEGSTSAQTQLANGSYVIDFKPSVSRRVVDTEELEIPEIRMPSLYREYFRKETKSTEDCDIEDVVQKFLSSNIDDMDEANNSPTLRARHPNYVEISIKRPARIPQHESISVLDRVVQKFNQTEFDKYYLEILSGFQNSFSHKRFVQVADETSPETRQTIRTNDRFSLNYLKVMKQGEDFIDLPRRLSNEQQLTSHINNVVNKAQHYPLRFNNYNNPEQLLTDDTMNQATFQDFMEFINSYSLRGFHQIMNGKKAPSYIIGYKIEKYSSMSRPPIQTFFIMERPGHDFNGDTPPIEFVDTQVKYGKSYTYRIYSIALVYGTEYVYQQDPIYSLGDSAIQAQVQYNHFAKLIEAPFFQKTVSLSDLPPLAPEVTFAPYQGISDRLRIILNHSVGSREEKPIKMLPGDAAIVGQMRSAQPELQESGMVRYYSDTTPQEYHMFMSMTPPRSYGDMYSNLGSTVTNIRTDGMISVIHEIQSIVPNQEYYFTFRSAETVGISNPSPVFKLRMVDTPNGIFMVLREYDMYLQREQYMKLDFKRALKISPSVLQRSIVYPAGTDLASREFALSAPSLQEISVGPDMNSIWGKKYKFRLTSKTSGKNLDLNIGFEQNNSSRAPVLEMNSGPCDPINGLDPVVSQQPEPEPAPKCLGSLTNLPVILGTINPSTKIYQPDPCAENPEAGRVILHARDHQQGRSFRLDLNALTVAGRKVNLVEWIRSIPGAAEYFACEDNPEELVEFLTPAVYEQAIRRTNSKDYRVVFGNVIDSENPHTPLHLQDGRDYVNSYNNPTGEIPARNAVRNEQRVFWTMQSFPEIFERPENSTVTESQEQAEKLLIETEWNPLLVDEDGFRPQEKSYKMLYFVRELIRLSTSTDTHLNPRDDETGEPLYSWSISLPSLHPQDINQVFIVPKSLMPREFLDAVKLDWQRDKKANADLESGNFANNPRCTNGGVWDATAPDRSTGLLGACVIPPCPAGQRLIDSSNPCKGCEDIPEELDTPPTPPLCPEFIIESEDLSAITSMGVSLSTGFKTAADEAGKCQLIEVCTISLQAPCPTDNKRAAPVEYSQEFIVNFDDTEGTTAKQQYIEQCLSVATSLSRSAEQALKTVYQNGHNGNNSTAEAITHLIYRAIGNEAFCPAPETNEEPECENGTLRLNFSTMTLECVEAELPLIPGDGTISFFTPTIRMSVELIPFIETTTRDLENFLTRPTADQAVIVDTEHACVMPYSRNAGQTNGFEIGDMTTFSNWASIRDHDEMRRLMREATKTYKDMTLSVGSGFRTLGANYTGMNEGWREFKPWIPEIHAVVTPSNSSNIIQNIPSNWQNLDMFPFSQQAGTWTSNTSSGQNLDNDRRTWGFFVKYKADGETTAIDAYTSSRFKFLTVRKGKPTYLANDENTPIGAKVGCFFDGVFPNNKVRPLFFEREQLSAVYTGIPPDGLDIFNSIKTYLSMMTSEANRTRGSSGGVPYRFGQIPNQWP